MSELNLFNGENKVISSKEIAELTGKRHDHVLRDIDKVLIDLELDSTQYWGQYKDSTGRSLKQYNLPKRESMILASGYNVKLRAAIIDRWAELELKEQSQLPQTFSQALRLAADQAEQLELQKPKVDAFNVLINSDGLRSLGDVAKIIGLGRNKMISMLRDKKVLMKNFKGSSVPYQRFIDSGYFRVKIVVKEDGRTFTTTNVTAKGMEYIRKIFDIN